MARGKYKRKRQSDGAPAPESDVRIQTEKHANKVAMGWAAFAVIAIVLAGLMLFRTMGMVEYAYDMLSTGRACMGSSRRGGLKVSRSPGAKEKADRLEGRAIGHPSGGEHSAHNLLWEEPDPSPVALVDVQASSCAHRGDLHHQARVSLRVKDHLALHFFGRPRVAPLPQ